MHPIFTGIISSIITALIIYIIAPHLKRFKDKLIYRLNYTPDSFFVELANKETNYLNHTLQLGIMNLLIVIYHLTDELADNVHAKYSIFFIMWVIYFKVVHIFINSSIKMKLIKDFENDLIILDTHLDEKKIKLLKSEWVKMRNQKDYILLKQKVKMHLN